MPAPGRTNIRAVVEALIREAKAGNVQAAREFAARSLAEATAVAVRLEAIEAQLGAAKE